MAWITEGDSNALIDSGLRICWENINSIADAINSNDPRPLDKALRRFHDRVVAAGSVLSASGGRMDFSEEPEKHCLSVAILATIGALLSAGGRGAGGNAPTTRPCG